MWEHINKFYLMVRDGGTLEDVLDNPYEFFDRVNVSGQQFLGVTDATMTHGEAWHFCQLGRMLERADKTSRILDVKYFILLPKVTDVGTPFDDIQWLALLRSASALEMYRQRHGRISPVNVVKFLVLDREFPRAVLHCLTRANESLHAISGTVDRQLLEPGRAAPGPAARRARLHARRRSDRRRPARIRRRLPEAAEPGRRSRLRFLLRQAPPRVPRRRTVKLFSTG